MSPDEYRAAVKEAGAFDPLTLAPAVEERLMAHLEEHLGYLQHMTPIDGKIYVGILHPLPTFVTAINLTLWWVHGPKKGRIAEMSEIIRGWYDAATHHEPHKALRMERSDALDLLRRDIGEVFVWNARGMFPELASYPEPAQVAVVDLCRNQSWMRENVNLSTAIARRVWDCAADLVLSIPLYTDHRAALRDLFMEATECSNPSKD